MVCSASENESDNNEDDLKIDTDEKRLSITNDILTPMECGASSLKLNHYLR